MRDYKIFGNERTSLQLTDKAFKIYSGSDPFQIREHSDGTYSTHGIIDRDGMTAQEVNELLESLGEE
jgi:hypothetical protein